MIVLSILFKKASVDLNIQSPSSIQTSLKCTHDQNKGLGLKVYLWFSIHLTTLVNWIPRWRFAEESIEEIAWWICACVDPEMVKFSTTAQHWGQWGAAMVFLEGSANACTKILKIKYRNSGGPDQYFFLHVLDEAWLALLIDVH